MSDNFITNGDMDGMELGTPIEMVALRDLGVDEQKSREDFAEAHKLSNGVYPYQPKESAGDHYVLLNLATDKEGNEGYYVVYFKTIKGQEYQKIIRKGADEDDSQDWFKVVLY